MFEKLGVISMNCLPKRGQFLASWWVAAAFVLAATVGWHKGLTGQHQLWTNPGTMGDFRDAVWLPGRYLWGSGNPYNHVAYLADHPYAQEFSPYAPAWLLLSLLFAIPNYTFSAALYLVFGALLAVAFWRTLWRWAGGIPLRLAIPSSLVLMTVWPPGRYTLQTGGNLLVLIGVLFVFREISRKPVELTPVEADSALFKDLLAAGIALSMMKPNYGLAMMALAMGAGRYRQCFQGIVLLTAASLPVVLWCLQAEGSFVELIRSILDLVRYESTASSPTGIAAPDSGRVDISGILARLGWVSQPDSVSTLVSLGALLGLSMLGRFSAKFSPAQFTALAGAVLLLGLVHQPYDFMVMTIPAALLMGRGSLREVPLMPLVLVMVSPLGAVSRHALIIIGTPTRTARLLEDLVLDIALLVASGIILRAVRRKREAGIPSAT